MKMIEQMARYRNSLGIVLSLLLTVGAVQAQPGTIVLSPDELGTPASSSGLVVDISADNGRSDVITRRAENWRVGSGKSLAQTFGDITIELNARGSYELETTP